MGHSQILGVYSHHHQHQFFIQTIPIVLMILWILVILVFQIHKLEVLTRRNIRTGIPALTPKKIFLTWWIEINFKIQGLYLTFFTLSDPDKPPQYFYTIQISMDWLDLQNPLDANSQFESIFSHNEFWLTKKVSFQSDVLYTSFVQVLRPIPSILDHSTFSFF